jgi:leucyl-tRNA synthetase
MNTAIASLMALLNNITATGKINKAELKTVLILLNPFAPHLTEEMWETCGFEGMHNGTKWPTYDEAKTVDQTVELPIQINGKVRGKVELPLNADRDTALATAKAVPAVASFIEGKTLVKEIVVPNKIINIVVR